VQRRETASRPVTAARNRPPEHLFQVLFEFSPVGVALSTLDGRFVEVNAAFRRMVPDAGPRGAHRRLEHLCRLVPRGGRMPDERPVDLVGWVRALRGVRSGSTDTARADLLLLSPDGTRRWVTTATVRITFDGEPYLITHLEDVTQRHQEEERLANLALRDGLTGLANRTLLSDRLDAALARSRRCGIAVAVLYLDLDGFKKVNDTLGHDTGDALLVGTADRLTTVLRAGDTAARVGGDEFVVVAENVGTEAALSELTRRVERALNAPMEVCGRQVPVLASIGAVLSQPGEQAGALLRRADAAMFAVKRAHRRVRRTTRSSARQPVGQLTLLQDSVVQSSVTETAVRTG